MSGEQINIAIGSAQLLFALLVFFRIDHRIFLGMKPEKAAPEHPLDLPIKSNRRAKLVLILLFGGLAFSAYGFYRTLQEPPNSPDAVSPAKIERLVEQWCKNFGLSVSVKTAGMPDTLFCYQVQGINAVPILVFRPKNQDRYLVLQSIGIFSPEHEALFSKLSKSEQQELVHELVIAAARSRINLSMLGNVSAIERRLPIAQLSEAALMDALDEVGIQVLVAAQDAADVFRKHEKAMQPSSTPDKGASPP